MKNKRVPTRGYSIITLSEEPVSSAMVTGAPAGCRTWDLRSLVSLVHEEQMCTYYVRYEQNIKGKSLLPFNVSC